MATIRQKSKQVPVGFTERHREMINQIMESKGYPSLTSVVQQAVVEMYENTFKDYVMAKKSRAEQPDEGKTASEIKKSNQTDKLMAIAKQLDGEVTEKGGVLMVKYFTYNRKNRYEQETPLETMSEVMVEKQYFPSKEEVEKYQSEGNVNYTV